ncbi:MAG: hypothetical protein HRT44_11515, partial [Bdellovibrionales bacterium]|nr:hypothetical protein [Bdellovibrionales bacterium]
MIVTISAAKKEFTVDNQKRHLVFQAGMLGHKPWDPKASFSVQINFNSAVFTKLINIDSNYNLSPGLIKDWQWDNKTKSYLFTLDKRFEFDSYRKIKAVDIEFAFLKSFLSELGEYKRNYFFDIVGVSKLNPKMKFKSGMCSGVKVVGEDKIRVYLNKPNPDFIYTLQDAIPVVAPVEDFKETEPFKSIPRGTGAYYVDWSSDKDSKVLLKRKKSLTNKQAEYPLSILFVNESKPKNNLPDLGADAGTHELKERNDYKVQYGIIPYGVSMISF